MNVTRSLLADIKNKQLQWYGHVQRMEEGRHKHTWAKGIRGLFAEKRLMKEDWNDGSNWRKKMI
jgi:hypothetical protein